MKKLTALFLTVLTVLTFVSCEKSKSEDPTKTNVISTPAPIAPTEEKNDVDEEVSEFETLEKNVFQIAQEKQWKSAYADYFSDTSIYSSVYVYDVNSDGIPEVFTSLYTNEFPQQVAAYRIDKNEITTFEFDIGSSLGGSLFFERYEKVFILREDIHLDYHRAVIYSLTSTGFVIKSEISGDELEDEFDYDDNAALEAYRKKSRELFDMKFAEFTKGMNLIDYADVAVSENIKAYLVNKLGLNES